MQVETLADAINIKKLRRNEGFSKRILLLFQFKSSASHQSRVSADQYLMTLSRAQVLNSSANKFLVFNWSQAQDYFSTHRAHEISCAYEPAPGLQARKVSLFTGREGSFYLITFLLHLTTTKTFAFVSNGHALVRLLVLFLSQIGQNLTGEHKFTWTIYAASGNLFTDSWTWQRFVSSDLIICFIRLFALDLQMKYICYQNLLLFMAGVFVGFLVKKHSACKKKKVIENHRFQK